jgi:hypothetical protein
MAYNKSSPGIHEQNAAKHTLAYAIWNGLMDQACPTIPELTRSFPRRRKSRADASERGLDGAGSIRGSDRRPRPPF